MEPGEKKVIADSPLGITERLLPGDGVPPPYAVDLTEANYVRLSHT
jgi:hypothetical protein